MLLSSVPSEALSPSSADFSSVFSTYWSTAIAFQAAKTQGVHENGKEGTKVNKEKTQQFKRDRNDDRTVKKEEEKEKQAGGWRLIKAYP